MVVWYGMVYHMVAVDHQFFVAEKFKLSPGIVKALVTTNHCTNVSQKQIRFIFIQL